MRVAVYGKYSDRLLPLVEEQRWQVVDSDPDLVISYGGDGALLAAERLFPGVPKFPVRDSIDHFCCKRHGEREVLKLFGDNKLSRKEIIKLEGIDGRGEHIQALNDLVVNKQITTSCLRYSLWIDGALYADNIVGDGVVVASPFGSTAYYRSITRSLFQVGIGLAFNNSTEPFDHLVLSENASIQVEITRGPAVMVADNDPLRSCLEKGDVVTMRRASHTTAVLGLDVFRCPACCNPRYSYVPLV